MAGRTRDGDSAGQLLRVLQDCDVFHMEAAIASLSGIRSDSQLKPSGVDDVDVLGRVLSLSDHKRIAGLHAALSTVANAYETRNEVGAPADREAKRNLVCAVAGTAMLQAMRDCTASRTNCCIWGPQAEKRHALLGWMMSRESVAASSEHDFVRELLLEWIQQTDEKQRQLAACLALFELLQRHRSQFSTHGSGSKSSSLLHDRAGAYLDALCGIVERGTHRVADLQRVKPSKLALIALEALALLCGDVAAQYMVSQDNEKRRYISSPLMRKLVDGMQLFLSVLRQWHRSSKRRQFLSCALQHLQSYATVCGILLSTKNGTTGETARDSDLIAMDIVCWHWEATAPLLCTRSDISSRIQKNQPSKVFARALKMWTLDILGAKASSVRQTASPEVLYAQLRYLCILMDYIGGVKGCIQAFKSFSAETKQHFVFFFVSGLSAALNNGDEATVCFIVKVLRGVLLPSDLFGLLNTRDEEQELLSELLRICNCESSGREPLEISGHGLQDQTEIELFVADFIISRELFITELVANLQDYHVRSIQKTISLARTFIYQLDNEAVQVPLYRHWRQQLMVVVLALIDHENDHVRRVAISCIPSLDLVSCIAELCAGGVHDTENIMLTSVLGYLFATSTQLSLEIMVSWFVDTCQFGLQPTKVSAKVHESPWFWNEYDTVQNESINGDDVSKELQEKLLLLCFGPNGWSKHIQSVSSRIEVLKVLLRKIFGSPRDPLLFRMVREFVACGWVVREVFEVIGRQLTDHMMNLERLTEDLLDDTSSVAAKTTEELLFSRLAPLLVLRMLPREAFGCNSATKMQCGCEDLNHLNEYIDCHRYSDPATTPENDPDATHKHLFHILACSAVDPLEFKEVKMLATEGLAKCPPPLVLPFAFAYLIAFLREATPHHELNSSLIVPKESIPDGCGLVTAKLMIYYLNRVFSEDGQVHRDGDITSRALVVLVKILEIPCRPGSSLANDESLLTDLQRGCIDCMALILTRLCEDECEQDRTKMANGSSLLNLLVDWIFAKKEFHVKEDDHKALGSLVLKLLERVWTENWQHDLPLQVRICCCNVLLSAISRSDNNILTSWKTQGVIFRIAQATESCSEDGVVAGGLQVIFSFLYKASELLSMENNTELQLVRMCFEITTARLESTQSETVAMSGLKVIGALIGKLPAFVGTLPQAELQRLIDRCLISLRDRRVSPAVSNLAQSLVQAMTSS